MEIVSELPPNDAVAVKARVIEMAKYKATLKRRGLRYHVLNQQVEQSQSLTESSEKLT